MHWCTVPVASGLVNDNNTFASLADT